MKLIFITFACFIGVGNQAHGTVLDWLDKYQRKFKIEPRNLTLMKAILSKSPDAKLAKLLQDGSNFNCQNPKDPQDLSHRFFLKSPDIVMKVLSEYCTSPELEPKTGVCELKKALRQNKVSIMDLFNLYEKNSESPNTSKPADALEDWEIVEWFLGEDWGVIDPVDLVEDTD